MSFLKKLICLSYKTLQQEEGHSDSNLGAQDCRETEQCMSVSTVSQSDMADRVS